MYKVSYLCRRLLIALGVFCTYSVFGQMVPDQLARQTLAFAHTPPQQAMMQADSENLASQVIVREDTTQPSHPPSAQLPSSVPAASQPRQRQPQRAVVAGNTQWQAIQPSGTYQDASLVISNDELAAMQQASKINTNSSQAASLRALSDHISQLALAQGKLKRASVALTKLVVKLLNQQAATTTLQAKQAPMIFSVSWWTHHSVIDRALWGALLLLFTCLVAALVWYLRAKLRARTKRQLQAAVLPELMLELAVVCQSAQHQALVRALCQSIMLSGNADQKSRAAVLLTNRHQN